MAVQRIILLNKSQNRLIDYFQEGYLTFHFPDDATTVPPVIVWFPGKGSEELPVPGEHDDFW